jgi:hypothetical protein
MLLEGGSGGGGSSAGGGGGGGGAIEIGTIGSLSIAGTIDANGGSGSLDGGGGSGGAIFLHGDSVLLSSSGVLDAIGGAGVNGGGGGRVLVEVGSGGYNPDPNSVVNVTGGSSTFESSQNGGDGVKTLPSVSSVPEPSSGALLALGGVSFAVYGWRRRKQAEA